jgi:hypothetical protein
MVSVTQQTIMKSLLFPILIKLTSIHIYLQVYIR